MVTVENRVGSLAYNLGFDFLVDLESYYSKQYDIDLSVDVVLRFRTPQDYNGKDSPALGDIHGKTITLLFKENQKKPYTVEYASWIVSHEFRHRMQILIVALHKEIAKQAKINRKLYPPKDYPDIYWHLEICESDANLFASETTGYTRPVKMYER